MMSTDKIHCDQTNIIVYLIVIFFGVGSWVDLNGLWVELPVMVPHLAEGWNLLSYLAVIIQLANIAPFIVTVCYIKAPGRVREKPIIYTIIMIGAISCILLAFFWRTSAHVAGAQRSIALLALQFSLALVDCTSSVVFLPFMVIYKPQYMTAYFIGEGMSGLIPSIAALAQGVGQMSCQNVSLYVANASTNVTSFKVYPVFGEARFSVQTFFFFLFTMLLLSGISFTLLNYWSYCKQEQVKWKESEQIMNVTEKDISLTLLGEKTTDQENIESREKHATMSMAKFLYFLFLTAVLNGISNGVLPSIQTFSCLPYGINIYHLAVVLANMANPLACFLAFFHSVKSTTSNNVLTSAALVVVCYIIYTAAESPSPILVGSNTGEAFIVIAWSLAFFLMSYVKVSIATVFRREGRKALLWIGAMTQVGSLVGALTMYILINAVQLFKSADYCPNS
ncbi:hypothetical protein FSP39_011533 [Pinctada imbricata]|uniref:Riboflavin transporter n=1 Tax=Pinctada imbricata TaxID=66713 RepID=A0AA89BKJ8_PINIB|nr:hypothetical protein FSP39_011533 [Pinctada imbricata]